MSKFTYINLLEDAEVEPNFYISDEYFEKAKFREIKEGNYLGVKDEDWMVFPPLTQDPKTRKMILSRDIFSIKNTLHSCGVWSDFVGYDPILPREEELIDHEFIYDPKSFLNLKGMKWEVFRKNIRKFPARYGTNLNYRPIEPMTFILGSQPINLLPLRKEWLKDQLDDLLMNWLSGFPEDAVIHDDDVMLRYVRDGEHRDILFDQQGKILGLNIWDENYKYINYRYCICRRTPYLSEFLRYQFYLSPIIMTKNKLVCDGGDLLEPSLYRFKQKLNPLRVREVHSWL